MSKENLGQCILCPETGPLTSEHIFPAGIGGTYEANILCENCNSKLGTTIDSEFIHSDFAKIWKAKHLIT